MTVHPIVKPLGLIFSYLAIIQSVIWGIVAIVAILVNREVLVVDPSESYGGTLTTFYQEYLKNDTLLAYCSIFVPLSLAWLGVSMYQLWILNHEKFGRLKNSFTAWTIVSGIVALVDLGFGITVAVDYNNRIGNLNTMKPSETTIENYARVIATEDILTFVTRGYILWIVNVASVVTSAIFVKQMMKKEQEDAVYNEQVKPIQAFENSVRRPTSFTEVMNDGDRSIRHSHVNSGFVTDDDDFVYEDGMIQNYEDNEKYTDHWNQNFDAMSWSNVSQVQLPRIGTQRRESPVHINGLILHPDRPEKPPRIPSPDYSPPQSPGLRARPVLKSTSNYAI